MLTIITIAVCSSVVGIVLALLLSVCVEKASNSLTKSVINASLVISAIALVGSVAGYSGGLSRVGAVGSIIPAALALMGGVSVYLFGVQKSPSIVVPVSTAVFAVTIALGFSLGAETRESRDTFNTYQSACIELFMNPAIMDEKRLEIAKEPFGNLCQGIFDYASTTLSPPDQIRIE